MAKITVGGIIKTSIVTAFTIATALIWKDVIVESIELIFPAEQLLYKFLTAILATVITVIAIYIILKTQKETEVVLGKFKNGRKIKKQ